jgi:hypothetical protein
MAKWQPVTYKSAVVDVSCRGPVRQLKGKMKTRAQFLLMGLLSKKRLSFHTSLKRDFSLPVLTGYSENRCNKFNSAIHTKAKRTKKTSALGRLALALSAGSSLSYKTEAASWPVKEVTKMNNMK